jgi:hypothetical protein
MFSSEVFDGKLHLSFPAIIALDAGNGNKSSQKTVDKSQLS